MRKFALVILDIEDKIIDRYSLDVVTAPQGLGFNLSISTLTGDIEDVITKVVQSKTVVKFTVNQYQRPYFKANSLATWLQKYSQADNVMALEYDDGRLVRYCEGRVTGLSKTELDVYKNLSQELEFTQTTPFFIKRENLITIEESATGKSYPFKYPYSYGKNGLKNARIENTYIYAVPLVITIKGAVNNPTIKLLDKDGNNYNEVAFLSPLHTGESIIINSAQKKIYKKSGGVTIDWTQDINPEFDTFLLANAGESTISINTDGVSSEFGLVGSWREYRL